MEELLYAPINSVGGKTWVKRRVQICFFKQMFKSSVEDQNKDHGS